MNERIRGLLEKIDALQQELMAELHAQAERLHYRIEGTRIEFQRAVDEANRSLRMGIGTWLARSRPQAFISVPFIYGMVVPLVFLDACISLYQAVCFPLYRIAPVRRRDYFSYDHARLSYLNGLEKLYCLYCSYANGLLAYSREIAARTEQYWCPIKHSRPLAGTHSRYPRFLDYGDPSELHSRIESLRKELAEERARHDPQS